MYSKSHRGVKLLRLDEFTRWFHVVTGNHHVGVNGAGLSSYKKRRDFHDLIKQSRWAIIAAFYFLAILASL